MKNNRQGPFMRRAFSSDLGRNEKMYNKIPEIYSLRREARRLAAEQYRMSMPAKGKDKTRE